MLGISRSTYRSWALEGVASRNLSTEVLLAELDLLVHAVLDGVELLA